MFRLNNKAFNILAAEIKKAAEKDDIAGEITQKIALKRLNKLCSRTGTPVTEVELKELFKDILPNFSDRAIKQAVKANPPPNTSWLTSLLFGQAMGR